MLVPLVAYMGAHDRFNSGRTSSDKAQVVHRISISNAPPGPETNDPETSGTSTGCCPSLSPGSGRVLVVACSTMWKVPRRALESRVLVLEQSNLADPARGTYDWLVIHPGNRKKAIFDAVVAVSILYLAITVPVNVAFDLDLWPAVGVGADCLFVVDVVLQFVHGYFDMDSPRLPVTNLGTVARAYYGTPTHIVPDLVTLLSLTWRLESSIRAIQLLAIARLWRLYRLSKRWRSLGGTGSILRVVRSLSMWVIACHWLACLFFLLGWSQCQSSEVTWVIDYWPELDGSCNETQRRTPLEFDAAGGPSLRTVYTRSLYWALSTTSSMGYGAGPTAITDDEYLLAIGAQICGACLSAIIFSNVASVINAGDAVSSRYATQLAQINEFARFHQLPPLIHRKLKGYHDLLFSINRGFDLQTIATLFPKNVQVRVAWAATLIVAPSWSIAAARASSLDSPDSPEHLLT